MVFGSFANFAQNDWGITMIVICQYLMALSFLWQAFTIYYLRIKNKQLIIFNWLQVLSIIVFIITLAAKKIELFVPIFLLTFLLLVVDSLLLKSKIKKQQNYHDGLFENYTLFLAFLSLASTNLRYIGSGIIIVITTVGFFLPFYIIKSVAYFKKYKENKSIAWILFLLHFCIALTALAGVFKTMHYPGANFIFNFASFSIYLVIMIGFILQYQKRFLNNASFIDVLKIPKTHVLLIFVLFFIRGTHRIVVNFGAPDYYNSHLPTTVLKLRNSGNGADAEKADLTTSYYFSFINSCQENQLIN